MAIATTGFFDGVHKGHKVLLDHVCSIAKERGEKSIVLTLWPHPRTVLQQDAPKFRLLNSIDEKINLIKGYCIDEVNTLKFDREFAAQTTREYFKNWLIDKFDVSTLVIGYDNRVGSDVAQTQDEMMAIAREVGIEPVRVSEYKETDEGLTISSTKIRDLLSEGNVDYANKMLGYRYGLEGVVVEGMKLGRKLGFPTANMELYEPLKVVPNDGVYAVWVESGGKVYRGMTSIGRRPTIGLDNERTIETYILDFDDNIYGLSLKIEFVARMREEIAFGSLDQLKAQLHKDRENSYLYLTNGQVKLR